jgi:lipopolysaccharide/colanic/teichoic acid biosynthesis glycosyltransferase
VKRGIDVVAAGTLLVVLAPVLAVVAVAVRFRLGRPVLFRQTRPGLGGRPFEIVKFRTMRDSPGTDADRLTPLGRRLRALSLDELPELWNVVRGDMSLVGPRPLLRAYVDRYTPEQARRHEVRPGITGWAQVHGRNAVGWDERLALDVFYVEQWSLRLDLRILFRTVAQVARREGISADGHATMPEFEGSVLVAPPLDDAGEQPAEQGPEHHRDDDDDPDPHRLVDEQEADAGPGAVLDDEHERGHGDDEPTDDLR